MMNGATDIEAKRLLEYYKDKADNAVPVVHGHWISVEDDVLFRCSRCDSEISTDWDYDQADMWNYCPHCGAKMDEVEQAQKMDEDKYAHWIAFHSEDDLDPFLDWKYLCSNCAHICRVKRDICPNCGAKMEEVSK